MTTPLHNAILKIIQRQDLTEQDMTHAMQEIMSGQATSAQIAGFLIGLETKGLTVEEITAATRVMRSKAYTLSMPTYNLIDIVGTGGDGAATFNISTAVAFVVAAAGGHVAKHGNRSISSPSGSADMIEQAGINLNLTPDKIQQCIEQIGIGFLFAPQHHPALQHAKQARKELGIRTFLNLLGPLTNPANATSLVVGVFAPKWLEVLAKVLINLGCQHAAIVHSEDGLDEISIAAPTQVAEVKSGKIYQYHITPEQYGFRRQSLDPIRVQSPAQSLNIVQSVLNDFKGPALDIVLLNAGMALYVAEMVNSIDEGIGKAKEVIASGKALEKLQQLAAFSHTFD